jgi:hypothetical protein
MAKAAAKRKGGEFIQALMSLGRNGDNTVGHLTDGEIVIPRQVVDEDPSVLTPFIRAMTKRGDNWRRFVVGQGDRNPRTGVQEFASKGDKTVGSSYGKSTSAAPSYAGGGGGSNKEIPKVPIGSKSPAEMPELSFAEGGPMGSAGSRPGGPADVAANPPGMFESLLGDAVGPPSGRSLGLLGTLIGLTPGVGTLMGLTSLAQALGLEGEVDWEPGRPNPGAREDSGQNLDHRSPMSRGIKNIATAAAAAGLIDPPAWLKRSIEGLSPLQQRAHIATRGTAGSDSGYRSSDAFNYYKGLLSNTEYENVLPVEHQYLRDIWGANYGANTSSLMQALAAI